MIPCRLRPRRSPFAPNKSLTSFCNAASVILRGTGNNIFPRGLRLNIAAHDNGRLEEPVPYRQVARRLVPAALLRTDLGHTANAAVLRVTSSCTTGVPAP